MCSEEGHDAGLQALEEGAPHRSGFCTILGRPNAGKSTLLNALVGEKIAIVSERPQTTRDQIRGIVSEDHAQIIFVDTPGIIEPRDRLNEALMVNVTGALDGIDAALHLIDATEPPNLTAAERTVLAEVPCPVLTVPTKVDLLPKPLHVEDWLSLGNLGTHGDVIPVSAVTGQGLEEVLRWVEAKLPVGPPLYDPDDLTDRDLRFLAAESVREKVFQLTEQEIPYASAVTIDEFREREGHKVFIAATIHVERESHKGSGIGKGGTMIREIGAQARRDLETLMGQGVYLEIHVKVRQSWRRRDHDLRLFGYNPPPLHADRRRKKR
jgi:GTP-binding protein Era